MLRCRRRKRKSSISFGQLLKEIQIWVKNTTIPTTGSDISRSNWNFRLNSSTPFTLLHSCSQLTLNRPTRSILQPYQKGKQIFLQHCAGNSIFDTWNSPARPPLKAQGSWSPLKNCVDDCLRHPVEIRSKRKTCEGLSGIMRGKGYRGEVSYFQMTPLKINAYTTKLHLDVNKNLRLGLNQPNITSTEGLHWQQCPTWAHKRSLFFLTFPTFWWLR